MISFTIPCKFSKFGITYNNDIINKYQAYINNRLKKETLSEINIITELLVASIFENLFFVPYKNNTVKTYFTRINSISQANLEETLNL